MVVAPVDVGRGTTGHTQHAEAPRTLDQIRHDFRESFSDPAYQRFLEDFEYKLRRLPADSPWHEVYRRIPEELLAAVHSYTGGWHRDINLALREGPGRLLSENAAHIDALRSALDELPAYEGVTHRGADLTPEQLARYKPGEVVREPAFTSTSAGLHSRLPGNTHFVVLSRTGREIGPLLSQAGHEREIIFRPDTEFKVLGVERKGGQNLVYLSEAGGPTPGVRGESSKPFRVLTEQGLSGDGYAAPGHWGRHGAAGGLIRHIDGTGTDRYLLAQNGPAMRSNVGKWQLPGGALNSRERPPEGFARETTEEIGVGQDFLDALSLQGFHRTEGPNGWAYTAMAIDSPTMVEPRVDGAETSAAKWFTRDELAEMARNGDLLPALADSLPQVIDLFHGHGASPDAATASQPARMDGYVQIGDQRGTNPGGTFVDPDGVRWYVKAPASDLHAKNEVLANELYRLAGVPVPEVRLVDLNGHFGDKHLGVQSRIIDGVSDLPPRLDDPAYLAKLHDHFVATAWLADRDVVGRNFENVITVGDDPVPADAGGALLYKAMGDPKGDGFTDHVGEIDSMRDPSVNPHAAKVFEGVTDAHLKSGVSKIMSVNDRVIREAVDRMDLPPHEAALLKDRLIARRQDLIDRFGWPDPPDVSSHRPAPGHRAPMLDVLAGEHSAAHDAAHAASAAHEAGLRHLGLDDLGPDFHSTPEDRQAIRDHFGEERFEELKHDLWRTQARLDAGHPHGRPDVGWDPILRRIPIEDQVALHYYTTSEELNGAMRTGDLAALEHFAPVIKGMVSALNEMPQHSGLVFRRIYLEPHQLHHLDVYRPGTVLREPSFISSSDDPKLKVGGNIEYVIESRTGRIVAPHLHARPQEREVIFTPDRHFLVLDSEEIPGGKRVYLRELVNVEEPLPRTLREADPLPETFFNLHPGSQHGAPAPTSHIADVLNGRHDDPPPAAGVSHGQPDAPGYDVTRELAGRHGAETVEAATANVHRHADGPWQGAYQRIPTEDLVSSRLFAQSDHRPINEALYGGHEDALAPYTEQVRTHDTVLERMPTYEGPVHRVVDLDPARQARYRPGEVVREAGYVIASGNPHEQFHGNTEFVIESRTGRLVGPAITEHVLDHEVHFRRDTPFEVTHVEDRPDGGRTIHLREVDGTAGTPVSEGTHAEHPPQARPVAAGAAHEVHHVRSTDLNPDTRTPLLPTHDAAALGVLRGEHSNTLAEGEALHASQWAHLRGSAEAAPLTREHAFESASTVEVRRLSVTSTDHPVRTVTEFTLKLRFQADPSMTPHDVMRAQSNILDAADLGFNHQHRMPDGSQPHLRVEFEEVPPPAGDDVVRLLPGNGTLPGERPGMLRLYADMDPVVVVHELGHHLGLEHEYIDGSAGAETLTAPGVARDASAMGSGRRFWADHDLVIDHNGNAVPGLAGLRDRHFVALHDAAAHATGEARGEARPAVPAEHAAPRGNPDISRNLPDHVRDLAGRTHEDGRPVFPPEGRDPIEHAMLLDRMDALFGDDVPPGEMTLGHLRYTEALTDAARRLYETAPDFSFRTADLRGLRHLADVLGAAPDGALPHAEVLHDLARDALGLDPAPHDVEGLTWLAEHLRDMGGRRALEPPHEALRRAAADRLGTLPSAEATLRAVHEIVEEERNAARDPYAAHQHSADQRHFPPADDEPADARPYDSDAIETFRRELLDIVRVEAQRQGRSEPEVLQQFVIQRALARIFEADPHDWMLKGGQSMLARYPDARPSSDIDLVRLSGSTDPDHMASTYKAALGRDFGDHLRFVEHSRTELRNEGVRVEHLVLLGDKEVMRLSVDLATERSRGMWKEPDVIPFPDHVNEPDHIAHLPELRAISLQDTLAHKVAGMYAHGRRDAETKCVNCEYTGEGRYACAAGDLPYRVQDLADVLLMALNTRWDGPDTYAMLHEEMAWRLEQGEPQLIPDRFEVPNPDWHSKFEQLALSTPRQPLQSLRDAIPLAHAFLDPLLGPEPPRGHWDPHRLRWVDPGEPPHMDTGHADQPVHVPAPHPRPAPDTPGVRRVEATGHGEPSTHYAEQAMIDKWDGLAAHDGRPHSLDAQLAELKARTDLPIEAKLQFVQRQIMAEAGYELTPVHSMDSKNLRIYAYQSGEIYSHVTALMVDPGTTIEIAYRPHRTWNTFRWEAHQNHVAYLDRPPRGVTAVQANAVAMWRSSKGLPTHGIDHAEITGDLIDIHAQPLRDALGLRDKLIDYGVDPSRIRLAHADASQGHHYSETRWTRSHLHALDAIRSAPEEARQAMVDAMRGRDETAATAREARAQDVIDRLHEANARPGDRTGDGAPAARKKYALLWIRDTRNQPVGGRHGPHLDTRPEIVRQTIETLRANDPDRRIVLLGDDLFARRPELREQWDDEGVLDGVDAHTLVKFWDAARNGGTPLSLGEQGLFFHRLNAESDIVQIGVESGALELPAMLGVPTVYFEAREHDGNKGNRWQLYWQPWEYGRTETLIGGDGNPVFDASARPVSAFRGTGDTRPAPLSQMKRVLFGPDLPDPTNRRSRPVAVYDLAKVGVTADRINRLVSTGEIDGWPKRLGRSAGMDASKWSAWTERDWAKSRYFAEQLHHWVRSDAATPEEAGRKWQAIRLTLDGVLEPDFHLDYEYDGVAVTHPYFLLHTDPYLNPPDLAKISEAYGAAPHERRDFVAQTLKGLFDTPEFRQRVVEDLRRFRLEPHEIDDLREAIAEVVAPQAPDHNIRPYTPPDAHGTGLADAAGHPPYADRLDTPVAGGHPTAREVLDGFDPHRAGELPDMSAGEAADHIRAHAADRPWLADALGHDPAVQRVYAVVDQAKGHILERHGPFADEALLERRVTHLEDPAQLDPADRARAVDAFADRVHRCPDTATAITDPVAFAAAYARAVEHPDVRRALDAPYDPDSRPGRVSIPLSDLLGPDGHLYCAGFRLEPVDGSLQTAWDNRAAWVNAHREGRVPDVPEPVATPVSTFRFATVEFFFTANAEGNGYEITTMFVEPGPREVTDA
ncbi:ADP-ribosyltransferase domain-containing protein [Actinomadura sp. DC4]|uniref:ADP-ribosyltransferase domain-containing protein n=1 Tax=Actinomadura sp. DC4 TaxID=3055069 RepID=UPI0025AEEF04|nr:ADP-ribosyltransferase domain-containing protein [Actinomadura sp. DC4]MDN3359933.1 ADP-ribosyltransferase domain-containing protein [Actinomadura sp. DC4]